MGRSELFRGPYQYPKSWKLFVSTVTTILKVLLLAGEQRKGQAGFCTPLQQKNPHRESARQSFLQVWGNKNRPTGREGLEPWCALSTGCFLLCGSAVKPLLLCRCSQSSSLHPRAASTGDFHEKRPRASILSLPLGTSDFD